MVGFVTPVYSAVGMDLQMEADADSAVESAGPASGPEPLCPCGCSTEQVSHGQNVEWNTHHSVKAPVLTSLVHFCMLVTRAPTSSLGCSKSCSGTGWIFLTPMISLLLDV